LTFSDNESGEEGGGAYITDSSLISNNIIRDNRSSSDGNDLFVNGPDVGLFNNNLGPNANFETANSPDLVVTDTTNYSQGNNIKTDPLLTDDFHLQYGSPAIDAGDNTAVQSLFWPIDTDFEGDPRIVDGNGDGNAVVDIGADEDARGDINKDGCVDRTDADIILHNIRADSEDPEDDINGDGTVNRADARAVVRLFRNPGGASCETVALDYAKHAGGTDWDKGNGIAIDAAGNNVVTGGFNDTATFGAGEPNETVLISAGSIDIFVAKYAPDGSLAWAKRAGGTSGDLGHGIAVDAAGNSVVTGYFMGSATFGAGEPNKTMLTSLGSWEIFVAKFAPDGSLVWVTQAGGTDFDFGRGIAVDAAGNSVVTGSFGDKATFGEGNPNETVLTSVGRDDIFIAKYAPDGSLAWATQAGGKGDRNDVGLGIAVDAAGNSVVTGWFSRIATFGAGEPNKTMLTSLGSLEIFVAKFAPDGSLVWVTQAGGSFTDIGNGIAVDASANSVVTGSFRGTATFGAGEPNETVLTNGNMFVAKYAPDGFLIWATQADGGGRGIAVDAAGNSVVTGGFRDIATFGAGDPNETVLTSVGSSDIFVAKYAPDGWLIWATQTQAGGGTSFTASGGIALDASDNSVVTGEFSGTATFGAGEENQTVLTSAGGSTDIFVAKYKSNP
jgi:dockerin type I repeat protein